MVRIPEGDWCVAALEVLPGRFRPGLVEPIAPANQHQPGFGRLVGMLHQSSGLGYSVSAKYRQQAGVEAPTIL